MAVSKRTRFEVLRRDNHTCRYCGQSAPDVKLTVDHVTPRALGGADLPSNLVAACSDCNSGKASSSPDAGLVDDVKQDALRHAELMKQAYAVMVQEIGRADDYVSEFDEVWTDEYIEKGWQASIARFYRMGVPIEMVTDAARRALANAKVQPGVARFKYMCGILWNQVSIVTEEATAKAALDGAWMTDAALVDEQYESYQAGVSRGMVRGGWNYTAMLQHVCDGLYPRMPEQFAERMQESVVS